MRYFKAVAEAGNISRAANRLNIAQSALSHHIANLEASLQVTLFVRRARGVTLTQAGHRLVEHAGSILRAVELAEHDLRSISQQASGPVSVGLSYTVTRSLALPLMSSVTDQFPEISLRLCEALSGVLYEWLLSGELDLALLFYAPTDSRIHAVPVIEEELYCIGPANLLGSDDTPITFREVLDLPLVLPGRAFGLRALIDDFALRSKITLRTPLEVESLSAMIDAVEAGLGCSLQSWAAVGRECKEGRIVARRVTTPPIQRKLFIATAYSREETVGVREIKALAIKLLRGLIESGQWPGKFIEPTK